MSDVSTPNTDFTSHDHSEQYKNLQYKMLSIMLFRDSRATILNKQMTTTNAQNMITRKKSPGHTLVKHKAAAFLKKDIKTRM